MQVWYDKAAGKLRIDLKDGLDSTIVTPDDEFTINPRINTTVCAVSQHGGGPTRKLGAGADALAAMLGSSPLPNLRTWVRQTTGLMGVPGSFW